VWLGWGGNRVAGFSLPHGYHPNPATPKLQHTLIHPSSGACDFSIVSPHSSCVLVSMCVGVSVWLGWGGIRVAGSSLPHGYHSNPVTPKLQHIETRTHDQCGDTTEKSQAPDDGCINV